MLSSLPHKTGCQSGNGICPVIQLPRILLPVPAIDLSTWAVIACDQHTAQPAYWQETARLVADAPSSLQLVLPEYYLEHPGELSLEQRISAINQNMHDYLARDIFQTLDPGCIILARQLHGGGCRLGLLLAIDLDAYDHDPAKKNLIRATEGTVMERIPPRVQIRSQAPMELPHVQVLIDDPGQQVLEPLYESLLKKGQAPLYETSLMQNGGFVRGWFLPAASADLTAGLAALADLPSYRDNGLLMAVGDGNHSLATAKAHWDALKDGLPADHPARFALVEVINLHDTALVFEPIHRTVAGLSLAELENLAGRYLADQAVSFISPDLPVPESGLALPIMWGDTRKTMHLARPGSGLAVALVQSFLDQLVEQHAARIDYIHGETELERLASQGQVGIMLPALDKFDLFPYIAKEGVFPRKTFSMGEAEDKRYYLEGRLIR